LKAEKQRGAALRIFLGKKRYKSILSRAGKKGVGGLETEKKSTETDPGKGGIERGKVGTSSLKIRHSEKKELPSHIPNGEGKTRYRLRKKMRKRGKSFRRPTPGA